jgi:uncharacterized HAD superfamily protein
MDTKSLDKLDSSPRLKVMHILIDIDDTLTDTTVSWQDLIEEATGARPNPAQVAGAGPFAQSGLTRPEFERLIDRIYHAPKRIRGNQIYPGAATVISAWRAAGHRVTVASDRRAARRAVTAAWLASSGVSYDELILRRHLDKAALARRIGADLAIDDRPLNLRRFTRESPSLHLATILTSENAPYLAEFPDLVVAKDWPALAVALVPFLGGSSEA